VDIGEGKTDNYIGGTGIALWSWNIYTCLSGCYSWTDPMTWGWTGAVQVGTIINLRSSLDGVITLTFTGASGKADNAGRYKLNWGNVISVSGATNITVKKWDILTFQWQSHCEGWCCTSHNGNVTVNVTTSQYSSLSFTPV
jgi:hypothetical protein